MQVRRQLSLFSVFSVVLLLSQASALAGLGPRVGLSSDPDQVYGGVQWDVGELAPSVRVMPSLDVGIGDDLVRVGGNVGFHYVFNVSNRWGPYAGGELSIIYWDWDRPAGFPGDDSDTDLGVSLAGGIETRLTSGSKLNFELRLDLDNTPDVQVHAGWIF